MSIVVDHTRDRDLTAQGNQAARSRALTHLLEIPGLPTVSSWSIDDLSDRLSGLIMADRDDSADVQRAKVHAWAEFLNTPLIETTTAGRITVSTEGRCEYGVPVRVWALLRADIPQEAAA